LLVAYSMAWQLQAVELTSERLRMRLAQQLSSAEGGDSSRARVQAITEMLLPHTAEWDAPNFATLADEAAASVAPLAALPTQEQLNLRARRVVRRAASASFLAQEVPEREPMLGSNAWVLAGWRTSSGAALVANDMHLGLGVPPVWYRARLLDGEHDWVGVTLPGTPALIAGSNTHIAWGFTNSYGDWFDLRSADCPKPDTPGVTVVTETLKARGGASQTLEVLESPAGIVYQRRDATDCVLVSWHALAPGTISLNIRELMRARSVADAVALAPRLGIAQQNMMVGDRAGRIAWTIAGSLPTAESGHPSLIDPQEGALWTANARAVAGAAEEAIGGDEWRTGSGYDLGARARQIRDGLRGLSSPATPAAMLALQRDARALYLARWRSLLLGVLDEDALRNHPSRAELRLIVAQWDARASVDSVGYRLVKAFHDRLERAVWQMMLEALAIDASEFAPSRRFAATVWRLVSEQPVHLLAPEYSDWRTFQLQQVDATLAELAASCPRLARCRWGDVNRSSVRHPLSRALPVLGHWLDMPDLALDGDTDMPLVQRPGFGASERFAVSPGHEAEGYLQLPGGQSGHPLSPFYRAGFDDWANGAPTPLLPGATRHRLDFLPLTSTSSTP
jgi:penicillin amidase